MQNLISHLSADGGYLSLLHDGLCDDVGQGTSGQVLHDDPEVVVDHVRLDEVDQVLVLQLFHHLATKKIGRLSRMLLQSRLTDAKFSKAVRDSMV